MTKNDRGNELGRNLILLHNHTDVAFMDAMIKNIDWVISAFDTIYLQCVPTNFMEDQAFSSIFESPLDFTHDFTKENLFLIDSLSLNEINALARSIKEEYSAGEHNFILWNKITGLEKICKDAQKSESKVHRDYLNPLLHALFLLKFTFFSKTCHENGMQIKGVEPENYQVRSDELKRGKASLKDLAHSLDERTRNLDVRAQYLNREQGSMANYQLDKESTKFSNDKEQLRQDDVQYHKKLAQFRQDENRLMNDRDQSMVQSLSRNHSHSQNALFIVGADHGQGLIKNLHSSDPERYYFANIVLDKIGDAFSSNQGYSFKNVTRKAINTLAQTLQSFYEEPDLYIKSDLEF